MTLHDFIRTKPYQDFVVVIRHDVDRSLPRALRMAKMEMDCGISATYHVRTIPSVFHPPQLTKISQMGHEVGYHYEVLTKARGDSSLAIQLFENELEAFRKFIAVETISMHGSPLSPWDNRDIWESFHLEKYNIVGEAYLSIDYSKVYYFTDTGRSWQADQTNLRDRVDSRKPKETVRTTDNLIDFLNTTPCSPVILNIHPNRWTDGTIEYCMQSSEDLVTNIVKVILRNLRRRK